MRAKLKDISSDEIDVRNYHASLSDAFCITLKLRIGVEDAVGADDFEVYVCNIKWLESCAQTPLLGAGYIIVDNYNFEKIESTVVDLISTCCGASWDVLGGKLSRYFRWEFFDYGRF